MFDKNVPLKQISYYKIGGEAKYFFKTKNIDDLISAVLKSRQLNEKIFILAGATNVLIDDEGFDGLIINPDFQFIKKDDDYFIKAGSGTPMKDLINFSLENSLSGLEWAAGLPGTLGGAIRGNAGAFGKEMKDIIESVVSLNISQKKPQIIKRDAIDCQFEYRSSIFKKIQSKEIILEASLKLTKENIFDINQEIEKNINYRIANHPMDYPSLGSTFKNIPLKNINLKDENAPIKNDPFPIIPVAYLISKAGLIGTSIGGAMISPKHPNFIINVSEATSSDVKKLIQLTKNKVKEKFNIELVEEIEYL
ncbi:MAG: UDP-N-acetylmuramate dehydrogenase [Patescibacteria group bacterium]